MPHMPPISCQPRTRGRSGRRRCRIPRPFGTERRWHLRHHPRRQGKLVCQKSRFLAMWFSSYVRVIRLFVFVLRGLEFHGGFFLVPALTQICSGQISLQASTSSAQLSASNGGPTAHRAAWQDLPGCSLSKRGMFEGNEWGRDFRHLVRFQLTLSLEVVERAPSKPANAEEHEARICLMTYMNL